MCRIVVMIVFVSLLYYVGTILLIGSMHCGDEIHNLWHFLMTRIELLCIGTRIGIVGAAVLFIFSILK